LQRAAPSAGETVMTIRFAIPVLAAMLVVAAPQALAANQQPLVLTTNQTSVMNVAASPGTIVVGNPSIADVTVEGRQIFLHGRAFGTTNVVLFDTKGGLMQEFEVFVQEGSSAEVSLYRAGVSYTFVCVKDCQPILHPGDEKEWFAMLNGQMRMISNMATDQKSSDGSSNGEATPPPAQ
jgi:hypothetical protein